MKITLFTPIAGYHALLFLQIVFSVAFTDIAYAEEDNSAYGSYGGNPVAINSPVLNIISLNIAHWRKNGLNQILLTADTIRENLSDAGENFRRLSSPVQLSLASVHLDFSRRKVRKKQTHELIAYLEAVPRPLILSGDFNAEWNGADTTVRDIVHSLGLRAHEPNSASLGTYRSTGKRLDWILISSDLEFVEYTIVPEVMSDHLAVSAHIILK